ncbi:integrase catalytic domain-containing protein [Trichonephila clavipes]|nr:integrase catalytic domain-containing protein [Trichonephila clavipes]
MQLISKFEELSTLDKKIENLIDIESLEEEIVTREEYRDKFIIWKIRAERYVDSVSNTAIQNSVENQPQNITLPLNIVHEVESRERTEFLVKPHDLELKNKNSYSNTKYFERTSHSYPQSNRSLQGHSRFHPSHKSFSSANELLTAAFSNCLFCFQNTHMSDLCSDFYWSLTHRVKRLDSSLVAVETRLGWSLQGKCDERSDCTLVHLVHSEEESISTELKRFWEIESLGILDKGSVTLGNGDEEILSEFDKSVNFVDGRYRVNLPWKPGMREVLQNNKTVARKRFEGLGFYLPHHAVIRSDKTTSRIRIVFDGSAHEDGQSSLNQSLYTGPNLNPIILELLLCFRESPVAFTADVKSAFLQIELDFRDRDFTRFFWTDNLNNEPYVLNFTRVLFGLRPSPYLLAATLKHHFNKYREQYPHTFELLNSSIYVDDLICGQNDVPDALRTTLECLQIFSDAGMLLRKWRSNSKQLNLLWQQEGVKTEFSETSAIDLRPPTKVLGLAWEPENDLIYFDPKDLLKFMSRRGKSKRFILSVVGRIFDPIGILGPFVIKLKCLLQELWTLE